MKKKYNGSVTIFLSLTISIFIFLFLTFFRICVIGSEKERIEILSDVANNSILGEYCMDLFNKYDLIYVDTSFLGLNPDISNLQFRIHKYLNKNLNENLNKKTVPWGNINIKQVEIKEFESACGGNGNNVVSQMITYVEDSPHMGEIYSEVCNVGDEAGIFSLLEGTGALEVFYSYKEIIDSMELPKKKDKDGKLVEVPLDNPADWVYGLGSDFFYLVSDENVSVSYMSINPSEYISNRGAVNTQATRTDYKQDENKLIAYLVDRFSNQIDKKTVEVLNNQLEYLIVGESSDFDNLNSVVERIFLVRLSDNLNLAFADGGLKSEARAAALLLEVCTLNPAFIEPVADSIVAACAYIETINDVRSLFSGGKAPIRKGSHNMSILNVINGCRPNYTLDEGYSYREWLEVMLKTVGKDGFLYRAMDIIEMEVRSGSGNSNFCMDYCVENFESIMTASGTGVKEYIIDRKYGYF